MKKYKVSFENASGSVWVDAESVEAAEASAVDILQDFTGRTAEGHGQVDVAGFGRAVEVDQ